MPDSTFRFGPARIGVILLAITAIASASPPHARKPPSKGTSGMGPSRRQPPPPRLPCGDVLSFQILLDRQGFSPGQIDGKLGSNFSHAVAAMQTARGLQQGGQPDCETWRALGGETSGSLIVAYTITEEDLQGPFEKRIPRDLVQQARLESLAYQSPLERLAEKFHVAPALLKTMNPAVALAPGASIRVPAVQPFEVKTKPSPDPALTDVAIQVSSEDSALRAIRSDGGLVFFAPVTKGSEHDPLPVGDWKVTGVQWHPEFHYNPNLFWDAKPGDTRVTIKPGPNNPVGVVWIALSKEHYGLHGTPEPGAIGRTESHGCVRLTNWDAARVAALVRPGTPVRFQ